MRQQLMANSVCASNCCSSSQRVYGSHFCIRQRRTTQAPRSGLVISDDRANFGVGPRGAEAEIQNSASEKFCTTTHVPSFIDLSPAVSEPDGLENDDSARTYRWTFDRFYKSSSRDRRLARQLKTTRGHLTPPRHESKILGRVHAVVIL